MSTGDKLIILGTFVLVFAMGLAAVVYLVVTGHTVAAGWIGAAWAIIVGSMTCSFKTPGA